MNSIKDIALAFCISAVISSAVGILCGNRLQKSMRYIISLTLVCFVISVATTADFKFFAESNPQNTVSYDTDGLYEYQARYLIADVLRKADVEFTNVKTKATKNEDSSIVINEIEISGCKNSERAEKALRDIGIDCNIRVVE